VRRRYIIPTALVATAAIAAGAGTGASAKSDAPKKLKCKIEMFALGQPNPSVGHLGFVKCPKPFDRGLHYNRVTITKKPSPGVPGAATGKFKNYYNRGTTKGTVVLTIVVTSPLNQTYTGTVTYTGGTGRFRHVKGSGKIECTTADAGAHKSCKVKSTLTGV